MQQINSTKQLDLLFVKSNDAPVLLFKHSTACSTSADAKEQLSDFSKSPDARGIVMAIVNVIEDRPLSDEIAQRTGVQHESPQVILIRNEKVVWDASHSAITEGSLQQAVQT